MGDSVIAKRVYISCPILLSNRVTLVDLVEQDMLDFKSYWGLIGHMLVFLQLIVDQG